MASDDGIVVGKAELITKFRRMGEAVRGKTLANTLMSGLLVIGNAARGNVKSQGLIKTRTLSRSIHEEITSTSAEWAEGQVGTNLEYAAIHEFGGVIKPKTAKHLAIPVGSYTGSPRTHSDLKVRKTTKGNLVMVDGGGKVQYVLKKSVEIPARPYMRPAFDEKKIEAQEAMASSFRTVITKAAVER